MGSQDKGSTKTSSRRASRPTRLKPSSARYREQGYVRLPVVDASAPASAALALMREHARSGVIAHAQGHSWLYAAPQIVLAIADNAAVRLTEIEPAFELTVHRARTVLPLAVKPLPSDSAAMKRFKLAMSRAGVPRNIAYALGPDLIRTLDAGPKDCYCRVDGQSVIGGRNGADCPDGHRGSVRCV